MRHHIFNVGYWRQYYEQNFSFVYKINYNYPLYEHYKAYSILTDMTRIDWLKQFKQFADLGWSRHTWNILVIKIRHICQLNVWLIVNIYFDEIDANCKVCNTYEIKETICLFFDIDYLGIAIESRNENKILKIKFK